MLDLKASIQRWTIFLGAVQVAVGCLIGMLPPSAVAWFRALVMAHIELTANGVLMIVLGLIVGRLALGARWLKAWFVTLQIGTWANGGAGLAAAVLGASSSLMPTLNEKFPPPNGTEHALVSGLLKLCAVTILFALALTVIGLLPGRRGQPPDQEGRAAR